MKNDPAPTRVDVRKGADNINLKRIKIIFAKRDKEDKNHLCKRDKTTSLCSPYICICSQVLTKKVNAYRLPHLEP